MSHNEDRHNVRIFPCLSEKEKPLSSRWRCLLGWFFYCAICTEVLELLLHACQRISKLAAVEIGNGLFYPHQQVWSQSTVFINHLLSLHCMVHYLRGGGETQTTHTAAHLAPAAATENMLSKTFMNFQILQMEIFHSVNNSDFITLEILQGTQGCQARLRTTGCKALKGNLWQLSCWQHRIKCWVVEQEWSCPYSILLFIHLYINSYTNMCTHSIRQTFLMWYPCSSIEIFPIIPQIMGRPPSNPVQIQLLQPPAAYCWIGTNEVLS